MTDVKGMEWDPDDGLRYTFWKSQREALLHANSSGTDIAVFLGGYRAGKSVAGARWVISNALRLNDTRWLAMGIDFSKASDTTHAEVLRQLPGKDTEDLDDADSGPENSPIVEGYNRQKHRLTLTNGSVIILGSADKWSRYASAEFSGVWCDEAAHYECDMHALTRMLLSRLSADRGPCTVFMTSTGNGYNQFYDLVERQVDENDDPLNLRIEKVKASNQKNPFIDDDTKEQLRRTHGGATEEQGLHGGFAGAEGRVYSDFNRVQHVIDAPQIETFDFDTYIYGYDAGWDDPRVLLQIGVLPDGRYVVVDEYYESESHVDDAIEWLQGRPKGRVYCEHEPSDIDRFRDAGWTAKKAEKSIDAGISEVRDWFESKEGKPGLLVSSQCSNTIQELLSYQESEVGKSAATDHACDALRYAIYSDNVSTGSFGFAINKA